MSPKPQKASLHVLVLWPSEVQAREHVVQMLAEVEVGRAELLNPGFLLRNLTSVTIM